METAGASMGSMVGERRQTFIEPRCMAGKLPSGVARRPGFRLIGRRPELRAVPLPDNKIEL